MNRNTRMRQAGGGQGSGQGSGSQGQQGGRGGGGGGLGWSLGASQGGHLRRYGGVGMILRHGKQFGLTAAQAEKLETLRTEFELEKIELECATKKCKVKLRGLMRNLAATKAEVHKAIDEVCACEAALRKMRYSHLQKARAVLKAAQRNKLQIFHRDKQQESVDAVRGQRVTAAAAVGGY